MTTNLTVKQDQQFTLTYRPKTMETIDAEILLKRLTGKQASFVDKYLGEARFNASLAAKLAGYKATSKHSFEAIGSENLTKPEIRKTIDEYFRMSRMTSDECLVELTKLARGDSKDKVRALALLSSHYGLLDGAGRAHGNGGGPVDIKVTYTNEVTEAIEKIYGRPVTSEERAERITEILTTVGGWQNEADRYNSAVEKNNQRIEAAWKGLVERYKDSPEAVEALTLLHNVVYEKTIGDIADELTQPQPVEPEIIPPSRRLQPAAIERMMRETEPIDHEEDHDKANAGTEPETYTGRDGKTLRPSRFGMRVLADPHSAS